MVELPGFFLRTELKDEEFIFLRLIGAAAMLLVESDKKMWRKYLRRENGKRVPHTACDKATHRPLNAALLRHKKLAQDLRGRGLSMSPCDA